MDVILKPNGRQVGFDERLSVTTRCKRSRNIRQRTGGCRDNLRPSVAASNFFGRHPNIRFQDGYKEKRGTSLSYMKHTDPELVSPGVQVHETPSIRLTRRLQYTERDGLP